MLVVFLGDEIVSTLFLSAEIQMPAVPFNNHHRNYLFGLVAALGVTALVTWSSLDLVSHMSVWAASLWFTYPLIVSHSYIFNAIYIYIH